MISWWQFLPEYLSPVLFSAGSVSIRWYSVCWCIGVFSAWGFLSFLLKQEKVEMRVRESVLDGIPKIFFGALIGGRLGYVLLYAPQYFWQHPVDVFFPFQRGEFVGFYGLSFFGGVVGVSVALWIVSLQSRESFFRLADSYAFATPIALFFGRMGNFFNGELFGRPTEVPWGMYFPLGDGILRHPSQLYEAFFEGVLLFFLLWYTRKKTKRPGAVGISFLFWYGLLRFFVEFFRAPDFQENFFFGVLTQGQLYSLATLLVALYLFHSIERDKRSILER